MPAAWDAAQSIRSTVDSIKQSQHYTKCTFTSPLWTFSKYWQLGLVFNALEKIGKAEVFIPSLNILGASCQESHLLLTCKPSANICCGSADYRQLVSCTNCNMYFYILKVGQASCILFPDCQNIDPRYQFLCPTCHQFNRKGALLYWVQSLAAGASRIQKMGPVHAVLWKHCEAGSDFLCYFNSHSHFQPRECVHRKWIGEDRVSLLDSVSGF